MSVGPTAGASVTAPRVSGLWIYPLKSAAGTPVGAIDIGAVGPEGDRRYMVVTRDGGMVTQRQCPRLALVRPALTATGLRLEAPGLEAVELVRPERGARRRPARVWADTVEAATVEGPVGPWLSEALGREVGLVYLPDDVVRPVDPRYRSRDEDRVSFADGFPLLVATEASLADLNARLATPVGMDRFRPNLVVAGASAPWAEDGWARLVIGGLAFDVAKPCARCVMTTIDQRSARGGEEPLKTLATFRRRQGKVLFGQNLVHLGRGRIAVGDRVEVAARS